MRRDEIAGLLPWIYREAARPGTPLDALLGVMEALHAPAERELAELDATFSPRRCPEAFLPLLARWVSLARPHGDGGGGGGPEASDPGRALAGSPGRLRELVAAAAQLARWRGTARGLVDYLETALGVPGFRVEENVPDASGTPRPFHVRVHAPAGAEPHRDLIRTIVEFEKPAYVTWEVAFPPVPEGDS